MDHLVSAHSAADIYIKENFYSGQKWKALFDG